MVFIIHSISLFFSLLTIYNNKYFYYYILFLALLPIGFIYIEPLKLKIGYMDLYIIVIFLYFTITHKIYITKNISISTIVLSLLLILSLLKNPSYRVFIDGKFIFIYFMMLVVITSLAKNIKKINLKKINKLLFLLIAMDIFYYFTWIYFDAKLEGITYQIYLRTSIVRYSGLTILLTFGIANFLFFNYGSKKDKYIYLLVIFIVSYISESRILLLFAFINTFYLLYKLKEKVLIFSTLLLLITFYVLFFDMRQLLNERLLELQNIETLISELHYRVIEPALLSGYEFNLSNILFGAGFGFDFYIQWFEYRDLNSYNISLDSFYATYFFKVGIIGTILLLYILSKIFYNKKYTFFSIAWIYTYMIVHNIIDDKFIILFLFLGFLNKIDIKEKT